MRIAVGLAAATAAVGLLPMAAVASPRDPQPLRERYDPGETATVVGYTGWDGQLSAHLMPDPCVGATTDICIPVMNQSESILVGAFDLEDTRRGIRGRRMSLTFTVPADLPPGTYSIAVCRGESATCYLGSSPLYVGVEPPADHRIVYHWPLDDPAISALPNDALLRATTERRSPLPKSEPASPPTHRPAGPPTLRTGPEPLRTPKLGAHPRPFYWCSTPPSSSPVAQR